MQTFILNPGVFTYPARLVYNETPNNKETAPTQSYLQYEAENGKIEPLQDLAKKAEKNLQDIIQKLGNTDSDISQKITEKIQNKIKEYTQDSNGKEFINDDRNDQEYKDFTNTLLKITNENSDNLDSFIDKGASDFSGEYNIDMEDKEAVSKLIDDIFSGDVYIDPEKNQFMETQLASISIAGMGNCIEGIQKNKARLSEEVCKKIAGLEVNNPEDLGNLGDLNADDAKKIIVNTWKNYSLSDYLTNALQHKTQLKTNLITLAINSGVDKTEIETALKA